MDTSGSYRVWLVLGFLAITAVNGSVVNRQARQFDLGLPIDDGEELSDTVVVRAAEIPRGKVNYDGCQVWRVQATGENSELVSQLEDSGDVSMWVGNSSAVDVLVRPETIPKVSRVLRERNVNFDVIIPDLQKAIEEENPLPSQEEMEELEGRKARHAWWQVVLTRDNYPPGRGTRAPVPRGRGPRPKQPQLFGYRANRGEGDCKNNYGTCGGGLTFANDSLKHTEKQINIFLSPENEPCSIHSALIGKDHSHVIHDDNSGTEEDDDDNDEGELLFLEGPDYIDIIDYPARQYYNNSDITPALIGSDDDYVIEYIDADMQFIDNADSVDDANLKGDQNDNDYYGDDTDDDAGSWNHGDQLDNGKYYEDDDDGGIDYYAYDDSEEPNDEQYDEDDGINYYEYGEYQENDQLENDGNKETHKYDHDENGGFDYYLYDNDGGINYDKNDDKTDDLSKDDNGGFDYSLYEEDGRNGDYDKTYSNEYQDYPEYDDRVDDNKKGKGEADAFWWEIIDYILEPPKDKEEKEDTEEGNEEEDRQDDDRRPALIIIEIEIIFGPGSNKTGFFESFFEEFEYPDSGDYDIDYLYGADYGDTYGGYGYDYYQDLIDEVYGDNDNYAYGTGAEEGTDYDPDYEVGPDDDGSDDDISDYDGDVYVYDDGNGDNDPDYDIDDDGNQYITEEEYPDDDNNDYYLNSIGVFDYMPFVAFPTVDIKPPGKQTVVDNRPKVDEEQVIRDKEQKKSIYQEEMITNLTHIQHKQPHVNNENDAEHMDDPELLANEDEDIYGAYFEDTVDTTANEPDKGNLNDNDEEHISDDTLPAYYVDNLYADTAYEQNENADVLDDEDLPDDNEMAIGFVANDRDDVNNDADEDVYALYDDEKPPYDKELSQEEKPPDEGKSIDNRYKSKGLLAKNVRVRIPRNKSNTFRKDNFYNAIGVFPEAGQDIDGYGSDVIDKVAEPGGSIGGPGAGAGAGDILDFVVPDMPDIPADEADIDEVDDKVSSMEGAVSGIRPGGENAYDILDFVEIPDGPGGVVGMENGENVVGSVEGSMGGIRPGSADAQNILDYFVPGGTDEVIGVGDVIEAIGVIADTAEDIIGDYTDDDDLPDFLAPDDVVQPVGPDEVSQPEGVYESVEFGKPDESEEPVEPEEPNESDESDESDESNESNEFDEPDEPAEADATDESNESNESDEPDEPDESDASDESAGSDESDELDEPDESDAFDESAGSDESDELDEPDESDAFDESAGSDESDELGEPDESDAQSKPDEPGKSDESDAQKKPDEPDASDKPDKPDESELGHRMEWTSYHPLEDIEGYIDYLAETFPDICSVKIIGKSVEGRNLKVLRISNGKEGVPAIWIDGGIHAREWISSATVTYIINYIVQNSDDLGADYYILAMVNPDGYVYTWEHDRLWRKNRQNPEKGRCAGVDLNRNFGYRWGGLGASHNPCREDYAGSGAFSEPETTAIREFFASSGADFKAYLTFHSYGQYVLYPWGYDRRVPPDYADLDKVGRKAAMAMKNADGARSVYTVGNSAYTLYPASGGADDWAKAMLRVKYAYTIELRDNGRYGFILPAQYIVPTANEALAFVKTITEASQNFTRSLRGA